MEVEDDNPKLRELLGSPIYDHAYYAAQLDYGLCLLRSQLRLHAGARRYAAEEAGGAVSEMRVNVGVDWTSSDNTITEP